MHDTTSRTLAATLTIAALLAWAQPAAAQEPESDWSWFLEQSARVFQNLEHTHVGAATALGARWRWLSFGIHTAYRPAAWSGYRKDVALPAGETYKGQTSVGLGQQYGWVGLYVAPALSLGERWALDLPVTFGQGFLGTPLQGDDRVTPGGERVSEIENRLLDDVDLTFGLALDVGARVRWFPFEGPQGRALGVGFAAGLHYSTFLGYEGPIFSAGDVSGLGGSLSIVLTPR